MQPKMTKGGRELELTKRDQFFSDPIFKDILAYDDQGLQKKLEHLKQRNLGGIISTQPNLRGEAAHNLQVTVSNDKFMIQLELPGFWPEDFSLKTRDNAIVLEAVHEAEGDDEFTSRRYTKEFDMPEGVEAASLQSTYSSDGILTIEAPRNLEVPEGAKVQEALAAQSKAYTTDEGKTSVNEKSVASSQVIAATTESPDGRTKSSMTFSSSSSSASSVISSGGPMSSSMFSGGFPSIYASGGTMGGPQFPTVSGMGPQMSLDMDSMMRKMMGDMSLGSRDLQQQHQQRWQSMMSSSFSTSSSNTSSTTTTGDMSQDFFGPSRLGMSGFNRPNIGLNMGMGMGGHRIPDLDIEELSTASSDVSGPPAYTVTSPPPTAKKSENYPEVTASHVVKPTADYLKSQKEHEQVRKKKGKKGDNVEEADCTVLLKLKEGKEYKLVLNMQQYSPEDITVKLNDRELTILAHDGTTEDFMQKHHIPEGIDLDQLTSSFSADGILVVKAPKLKK